MVTSGGVLGKGKYFTKQGGTRIQPTTPLPPSLDQHRPGSTAIPRSQHLTFKCAQISKDREMCFAMVVSHGLEQDFCLGNLA